MTDSQESQPKQPASPGRRTVLTILAIAVLAAAFAWWWNFNRGRKALEFYGPEAATLIRTAPKVEILRSQPETDIDISKAPGLINARASLLSDASYDWSATRPTQQSPLFSVRFSRGEKSVVVTFDFENQTISNSATERTIAMKPKTADGWRKYLARLIETQKTVEAHKMPSTKQ
jgi:hypothetical protein